MNASTVTARKTKKSINEEDVIKRIENGESYTSIAEYYGYTCSGVRQIALKHGFLNKNFTVARKIEAHLSGESVDPAMDEYVQLYRDAIMAIAMAGGTMTDFARKNTLCVQTSKKIAMLVSPKLTPRLIANGLMRRGQ